MHRLQQSLGCRGRVQGLGCRVRVQGLGCRGWGAGVGCRSQVQGQVQGRVQDQVQTVVKGWGVERRGGPAWGETQSAGLGCRIGV